jgi:hypothetical protein
MKIEYPYFDKAIQKKLIKFLNLEELIIGQVMSVKILKKNFLAIIN